MILKSSAEHGDRATTDPSDHAVNLESAVRRVGGCVHGGAGRSWHPASHDTCPSMDIEQGPLQHICPPGTGGMQKDCGNNLCLCLRHLCFPAHRATMWNSDSIPRSSNAADPQGWANVSEGRSRGRSAVQGWANVSEGRSRERSAVQV